MTLIFERYLGLAARMALCAMLALIASLPAQEAAAHAFKTSSALVNFDRDRGVLAMRIDVNLEAIMAHIDPEVTDTSQSPNAAEYNRLRALSGEQLKQEYQAFRQTLLNGMRFELDGKRFTPELADETFKDLPDLTLARNTTLEFKAPLPADAKAFTFGWDPTFGKITVRTRSIHARSAYFEVLENGATSAPLVIDDLKARRVWSMIGDFIVIGFHHIVPNGLDHILFVTGIFLLSARMRPLLTQVTAFTVAHTVTLGLGSLNIINVSNAIVDPLIAASIVYVGVENIRTQRLSRWRPVVVFCFGLLHGLGFAGTLRTFNIPQGEFLTGLLSFNVGVELGQLAIILVCFLMFGFWFGDKPWYRQRVVIPGSLVISVIAAYWFVQRVGLIA